MTYGFKWHKKFGEFSHKHLKVILDKSSVDNAWRNVFFRRLGGGAFVPNQEKEKKYVAHWTHWISTFWTFHCLPEVSSACLEFPVFVQIPHVIFEIKSQFLYKLCTIL